MKILKNCLDEIESGLLQSLNLVELARRMNVSPSYLSRMFKAVTQETVMSYQKKRRLSEAALLLRKSEERILDLALNFGFDSHEAFTRAFKNHFQVSPDQYRKMSDPPLHLLVLAKPTDLEQLIKTGVSMIPQFTEKESFVVVGMKDSFSKTTVHKIPELWKRFVPRIKEIQKIKDGRTYGVCLPIHNGEFKYMAGIEVTDLNLAQIPTGLEAVVIPKSRYAVFTHKLDGVDIHRSIKGAVDYIWQQWLPNSGLQYNGNPDFETYDDKFDPVACTGEITIYIPIQ